MNNRIIKAYVEMINSQKSNTPKTPKPNTKVKVIDGKPVKNTQEISNQK